MQLSQALGAVQAGNPTYRRRSLRPNGSPRFPKSELRRIPETFAATRKFKQRRVAAQIWRGSPLPLSTPSASAASYGENQTGTEVDNPILSLPPKTELKPPQVKNVFNYPRTIDQRYKPLNKLGTGSFGIVTKVESLNSGRLYACKSISKVQRGKKHTTPRYLNKIQNEVECMYKLGYSLDAVGLKNVYEDDDYVHIVMELCTGGPLIGGLRGNVSEERLVQMLKSVLRFIAQCHSKNLVYRDINHLNFLFSDTAWDAPLKATDFGLALQHRPGDKPLNSRAGTPVYMAPEVIERSYTCQADVWSAGILFFLMLTGRYPYFADADLPSGLSITELFSIITDKPLDVVVALGDRASSISQPAIDLLTKMLERDPSVRITAADALQHEWMDQDSDMCCTAPLGCSVVQRIQRFAVNGHLKQHVLNLIADDILGSEGKDAESAPLSGEDRELFLEPLVDFFDRVDTKHTGEVLVSDILHELQEEGYEMSDNEAEKLISTLDIDNDGHVLLDEFVSSLMDWQHFQNQRSWEVLVRHAFDRMDLDEDGVLSFSDILEGLTNPFLPTMERQTQARLMMHEVDLDRNGEVTWDEFWAMMMDSSLAANSSLTCYDRRYVDDTCDITSMYNSSNISSESV